MNFDRINEFDKHRRDVLNLINTRTKRKSELTLQQKEIENDLVGLNGNVETEYKRQLKIIKDEFKIISFDIKKFKEDVRQLNYIINILSYIGDDDIIVDGKNNI